MQSAAQLVPTRPLLVIYLQWGSTFASQSSTTSPATHLSRAMGGVRSQVTVCVVDLCIGHYPPAAVPPLPHPLLQAERDAGEVGNASQPTDFDLFTLCLATGSSARTTRGRRARKVRATRAREP